MNSILATTEKGPVLIAPRPVRLAGAQNNWFAARAHSSRLLVATDSAERSKGRDSAEAEGDSLEASSDRAPSRASRSPLPSEAMEEFLSILKPSFFPPSSPVRAWRQAQATNFHHARSPSFAKSIELVQSRADAPEESEMMRAVQRSRGAFTPSPVEGSGSLEAYDAEVPRRWFTSSVLSSPVSRKQTRNPFQRHYADASPSPSVALSPAAIPLPLPTPEEMLEI
ncbi:hypothetical protein BD626DRAFT_569840 [Schizophyllum amplum]|uniref:Uncharacterized protein n=1 Tax=Schizophyllum amplum TaxID=97359 RepID=A0A550CD46_9AGAR|nr:hypothetical protein BD626DRAFT_569840 [Auriculariopsis ampla]